MRTYILKALRKLVLVIAILSVVIGVVIKLSNGTLHISLTDSLKNYIFITYPINEISKNDTIAFIYKGEDKYIHKKNISKFIKHIKCQEGNFLHTIGKDYYCNNKFLGSALERDSMGIKLNRFAYNGMIPEGKFFVMGDDNKSYDSRYWGFVDKDDIIGKSYAIY